MTPMRKLLALVLVVPMLSLAQTEPKQKEAKTQNVIFGEDDVLGTRDVPSDEFVNVQRPAHFDSLIKVRTNFNDKLLSSVHEM